MVDMEAEGRYFDTDETRSMDMREAGLFAALPDQIAHARSATPAYSRMLADIDPSAIVNAAALARLPVTDKKSLIAAQSEDPPLGGFAARPATFRRWLFASPGPLYEPGGAGDWWGSARALFAAGFRYGMVVQNCFSYHFTPAGMIFESGAHHLGCCVIPAGTGQGAIQLETARRLRPDAYSGTPDFLLTLLEKAEAEDDPLISFRLAAVGGGALYASLATAYEARGISVRQNYGTADLGIIAYESIGGEGLIINENLIVELLDPVTRDPVDFGETGEVVVTSFNRDYPLLRFATGDLSAFLDGESPCGRTNRRLRGWLGRADSVTKIRGLFVHPLQIERALAGFTALRAWRLVVFEESGRDQVRLECVVDGDFDRLTLAAALQAQCRIRVDVAIVAPAIIGSASGQIDDRRNLT